MSVTATNISDLDPTVHLKDIGHRVGNDQLKAIVDQFEALKQQAAEWQKRAELIATREPRWRDVKSLFAYATDLPIADQVCGEIDAIDKHAHGAAARAA